MKREERLQRWVASWPAAVRLEVEVWLWGMCGHGGRLVSGAVKSTTHVNVAGVGSTFWDGSFARTLNVCVASLRDA